MKTHDTRGEFIAAFWNIYEDKPLRKISVSQLCAKAGYSRVTFYNHFKDMFDLWDAAVDEIVDMIKIQFSSSIDFDEFLERGLVEVFYMPIISEKGAHLKILVEQDDFHLFRKKVMNEIMPFILDKYFSNDDSVDIDTLKLALEYQSNAILGVFKHWFSCEDPIPIEELAEKVYTISCKGVISVVRDEIRKAGKGC